MPKISVILPVYNSEQYLHEAVTSILNQTYNDFTLYAINDGSTDKSLNILSQISDKRLKIISNERNMGLIHSLNLGISKSTDYQYIARMDADDVSLPDRFAHQVEYLDRNPETGVVGTSITYFGGKDKPKDVYLPEENVKILPALICKNPIVHPTVMLRNSILEKTSIRYNTNYVKYEDYKLWLDLASECKFHNIKKVLLGYRRHTSNISNTKNYELTSDMSMIHKIFTSYSTSMNIDFTSEEIYILSIITSVYRWEINKHITVGDLSDCIVSVVRKHRSQNMDLRYLKHLLWERGLVYLLKCKRHLDLIKLISTHKLNIDYLKLYNIHRNWF